MGEVICRHQASNFRIFPLLHAFSRRQVIESGQSPPRCFTAREGRGPRSSLCPSCTNRAGTARRRIRQHASGKSNPGRPGTSIRRCSGPPRQSRLRRRFHGDATAGKRGCLRSRPSLRQRAGHSSRPGTPAGLRRFPPVRDIRSRQAQAGVRRGNASRRAFPRPAGRGSDPASRPRRATPVCRGLARFPPHRNRLARPSGRTGPAPNPAGEIPFRKATP